MGSKHHKQPRDPDDFQKSVSKLPWGPGSAVLVTVLAFVGSQVLAGLILGGLLVIFGGSLRDLAGSIASQFYYVVISDALILLAIWLFLRSRKANPGQLGFGRRPAWKDLGYALSGYLVYFGLLIVAVVIVGVFFTQIDLQQRQELGFDAILSPSDKVMALISLVLLPPIVEEVVFRGFVFTGLRKKLKFIWAAIITSLLFAGPHLLASSDGLLWIAGIDTLVLSVVLCYLREKTAALWAPIAVHAFKNGIAFTFLLTGAAAL
jgi:membrane protease YdiL (CAAX protease family)